MRNFALFDSPGGLAASPNSLDCPYGQRQQRSAWFVSAVYDVFPWLQLGLDGTYVHSVVNRGYEVLNGNLTLDAASPLNPFQQNVNVSLNEVAPLLGENYSEARLDFTSAVLGVLLKLPADWRVSLDTQYAHNLTQYRGSPQSIPSAGSNWLTRDSTIRCAIPKSMRRHSNSTTGCWSITAGGGVSSRWATTTRWMSPPGSPPVPDPADRHRHRKLRG